MATRTRSPSIAAELSPEILWYLESRGYEPPTCHPLIRTPEPRRVKGALFDPARVDQKIAALAKLRHTKGKWAGLPIEPTSVQVAYIIAPIFGWVAPDDDGRLVRIIREVYIDMPRKGAKALAIDTPIWTIDGWSTMAALRVGDHVFGPDGEPTRVTHVSAAVTGNDCYRITTVDGRSLIADAGHLWTVLDRQHKASRGGPRWVTLTTAQLIDKGITRGQSRPEYRWCLPRQHAPQTADVELPIDPYVLGVWLGDGATATARISVGFDDLEATVEQLKRAGCEFVSVKAHRTCHAVLIEGLQPSLRAAGLLGDKHIPETYLVASEPQRLALLQGLMDTDGTIDATKGRASFCGKNRSLVENVVTLARSLGFRATLIEGDAKIGGRTVGRAYRAQFHVAAGDPVPFRLPRKASRCGKPSSGDRRHAVGIKSIEPVESVPVRCIKVDRADGLFLAGRDLMVTHNTTLVSALAMLLGFADDEPGAEVLLGAASRDQAGQAYKPLEALARSSRILAEAGVKATKKEIVRASDGSVVKAVSSRGDLAHGANVHAGLVDELHVHKSPDLLEAIESGTGAREQPMVIIITTADDGQTTSVYAMRRALIEKVASRVIKAPAMYGVVFAAEESDDPFDPRTWAKCNPLYPVTPSPQFMRAAADKARAGPVELASFLRLHLGIRAKQDARYLDLDRWDRNASMIDEVALGKRQAFGGLDLGSTSDLTALAWLFPDRVRGGFDVLWRFWMPAEALPRLDARTQRNGSAWVKAGLISLTPGDVTDYDYVRAQIDKDRDAFDVQGIGYDRWNSTQMIIELEKEEAPMIKVGQGYVSMSAPMKEVNRLVLTGTAAKPLLRHGGNLVARWMADNLRVASDAAGNVKPDKATSMDKIDGMSALVTAMAVAMGAVEAEKAPPEPFALWGN